MTTHLDVLLLESQPGAGTSAADALTAAGHRIHRCFDGAHPDASAFPCTAMTTPGSCPLDASVDVALLVRDEVSTTPTTSERGVACAVRAGVPLVEQGGDALDDVAPWIDRRAATTADVLAACEAAVADAAAPLRADIIDRLRPLLQDADFAADDVGCRLMPSGGDLGVHLDLPADVGPAVEHALAVRALDAVRSAPGTHGQVRVFVHHPGSSS